MYYILKAWKMKVKSVVKWFDLWVGFYWDGSKKRLYFLPIPCVGLCFDFSGTKSDLPQQEPGE